MEKQRWMMKSRRRERGIVIEILDFREPFSLKISSKTNSFVSLLSFSRSVSCTDNPFIYRECSSSKKKSVFLFC